MDEQQRVREVRRAEARDWRQGRTPGVQLQRASVASTTPVGNVSNSFQPRACEDADSAVPAVGIEEQRRAASPALHQ